VRATRIANSRRDLRFIMHLVIAVLLSKWSRGIRGIYDVHPINTIVRKTKVRIHYLACRPASRHARTSRAAIESNLTCFNRPAESSAARSSIKTTFAGTKVQRCKVRDGKRRDVINTLVHGGWAGKCTLGGTSGLFIIPASFLEKYSEPRFVRTASTALSIAR